MMFALCVHGVPHLGQRCGYDLTVALSSMSGASNIVPQDSHLNFTIPLNIGLFCYFIVRIITKI